jgi:hypothetical protein
MLYNYRIVETDVKHPLLYGRYWCFGSLSGAAVALMLWDGSADTEPIGWVKAWDGRYNETATEKESD